MALRVADEDPQSFTEWITHELSNSLSEITAQHGLIFTTCGSQGLQTPNLAVEAALHRSLQPNGKHSNGLRPGLRSSVNALQVTLPTRVLRDGSRKPHTKDRDDCRNPGVRELIGQRHLAW